MVSALLLLVQLATAEVVEHAQVDGVALDVAASSVLVEKGSDPRRYGPRNVVDDDWRTVWSEGVAGDGLGQWIELRFPQPTVVLGVELLPGHGGGFSPQEFSLWAANNVVTQFELFVDGRLYRDHAWTLDYARVARFDESQHTASGITFFFPFGKPRPVTKIRLVVRGVQRGDRFRDTCIDTFRPVIADASGAPLGDGVVAHVYRFARAKPDELERFLDAEGAVVDREGSSAIKDGKDPRTGKRDPRAEGLRAMSRFLRETLDAVPLGSMFFVDWSGTHFSALVDENRSATVVWKQDPGGRWIVLTRWGPRAPTTMGWSGIQWN